LFYAVWLAYYIAAFNAYVTQIVCHKVWQVTGQFCGCHDLSMFVI